ncbi:hypothetical protein [Nostoc sp. C117]|uniref:hypothetical protein n=1 Tax=Nostoc sp. C117 TaxID=3349875 RepID=UPI00370D6D45
MNYVSIPILLLMLTTPIGSISTTQTLQVQAQSVLEPPIIFGISVSNGVRCSFETEEAFGTG